MDEPENHTAVVDKFGGTWVRDDEHPGQHGNWWPRTDGPGWDERVQNGIGVAQPWEWIDPEYGPWTEADAARTAETLELVRRAVDF